jgi:hypothetical protein
VRPTRDLDLLGFRDDSSERLARIFVDICDTPVEPDGLEFDSATVNSDDIREGQEYSGQRVTFPPTIEERQRDYWDGGLRGFGVRVSYGGRRVFVVRYRIGNRLRRLTIGPYPALKLAEARKMARAAMGDVAHGDDPAQDKQERRDALTFKHLATSYLDMAKKRHRRWGEAERIINKDLLLELGRRLLVDIRWRDVRELVENIARKRDAPIMANQDVRRAFADVQLRARS